MKSYKIEGDEAGVLKRELDAMLERHQAEQQEVLERQQKENEELFDRIQMVAGLNPKDLPNDGWSIDHTYVASMKLMFLNHSEPQMPQIGELFGPRHLGGTKTGRMN